MNDNKLEKKLTFDFFWPSDWFGNRNFINLFSTAKVHVCSEEVTLAIVLETGRKKYLQKFQHRFHDILKFLLIKNFRIFPYVIDRSTIAG